MQVHIEQIESPVGMLVLAESAGALCALDFECSVEPVIERLQRRHGGIEVAAGNGARPFRKRIEAYFAGDLHAIEQLQVNPAGTAFQREVWSALQRIPAGSTTCYSELAATIGRPSAVRAVGMANARNPIAVVIPCHRVVGRDGSLTGYAGGLERKRWLLQHEGYFRQAGLELS
jgi:methylated-DNA-[protein]-cysteine S-methyltransferase